MTVIVAPVAAWIKVQPVKSTPVEATAGTTKSTTCPAGMISSKFDEVQAVVPHLK